MVNPDIIISEKKNFLDEFNFLEVDFVTNIDYLKGLKGVMRF